MVLATFDTLEFIERLEKSGVSRDQVEAQKDVYIEAMDVRFSIGTSRCYRDTGKIA